MDNIWNVHDVEEPNMTMTITINDVSEEEGRAIVSWRSYWLSLWELDQKLRSISKYDDTISNDTAEAYDHCRELIRSVMGNNNCSLEDLQ
mgnify:FL=1